MKTHTKSHKTWVLIADGARARLVEACGPGGDLKPVGSVVFAASHAPSRDFGTDKPGRTHNRSGTRQTALQPRQDWHMFEKEKFAAEMADLLDRNAHAHAFERLVLVAPPKTLGVLRDRLGDAARGCVVAELNKDLTHLSDYELASHLNDALRP